MSGLQPSRLDDIVITRHSHITQSMMTCQPHVFHATVWGAQSNSLGQNWCTCQPDQQLRARWEDGATNITKSLHFNVSLHIWEDQGLWPSGISYPLCFAHSQSNTHLGIKGTSLSARE